MSVLPGTHLGNFSLKHTMSLRSTKIAQNTWLLMVKSKFPGLNITDDKRTIKSWQKIYTNFLNSNLFDLPDLYARATFSASSKRKVVEGKQAIKAREVFSYIPNFFTDTLH